MTLQQIIHVVRGQSGPVLAAKTPEWHKLFNFTPNVTAWKALIPGFVFLMGSLALLVLVVNGLALLWHLTVAGASAGNMQRHNSARQAAGKNMGIILVTLVLGPLLFTGYWFIHLIVSHFPH